MNRRMRRNTSLAIKSAELALATPLVIAERMTRMALAGSTPSARDRKEFHGMISEKAVAFAQSWQAMAWQAARVNQAFAASFFQSMLVPGRPPALPSASALHDAALGVLGVGLGPVHRKALANARRLVRSKRR